MNCSCYTICQVPTGLFSGVTASRCARQHLDSVLRLYESVDGQLGSGYLQLCSSSSPRLPGKSELHHNQNLILSYFPRSRSEAPWNMTGQVGAGYHSILTTC